MLGARAGAVVVSAKGFSLARHNTKMKATRVYDCEETAAHAMPTAASLGTSKKSDPKAQKGGAVVYKVELGVQLVRQQQLEDDHGSQGN